MNFAVVSYPEEDDYQGIVPTNWITSSEHTCLQPPVATDIARNKLILARQEPGSGWRASQIKILKKFETYETAKSYLKTAEMTATSNLDTRSPRVSKRMRKKRKIILPGESFSSDDEFQQIKKFLNSSYSPPPRSCPTSDEVTQSPAPQTHGAKESSSESASSTPSKATHHTIEIPPERENSSAKSLPKLTHCTVNLSPILKNTLQTLSLPKSQAIQTSPTLANHIEQITSTLPTDTEQTTRELHNHTKQTALPQSNHTEQTTPALPNHTKPTTLTLSNHIDQTPPTLKIITTQTPTMLENHTFQTLPTLEIQNSQNPQTTSSCAVQTPSLLTNHTDHMLPTLNLHLDSSEQTLPPSSSTSRTASELTSTNQTENVSTFQGLLHPVSLNASGNNPAPPSTPSPVIFVDIKSEEVSLQSPSLSSPESCRSTKNTSIKSEIASLKRSQEMMWGLMGEFSQKLDSILGALARIENRFSVNQVPQRNFENSVSLLDVDMLSIKLPLTNTEFPEFEEKLLDQSFRQKLTLMLSSVSGDTLRQLAMNIIKRIITNDLAEEFSLTGKTFGGVMKKSFVATKTYLFICQLCLQRFPGSVEKEIRDGVGDWLMQAKFRRQRKQNRAATGNNLRERVTAFELNL